MTTTVIVNADGDVLVVDPPRDATGTPILPDLIGALAVDITALQAAKFATPGRYNLGGNGLVTVSPPPPPSVTEVEHTAAHGDLATTYQAAMTRLNAIVTDGPVYSQAQARDAIVDMAKIVRATLRFIRAGES